MPKEGRPQVSNRRSAVSPDYLRRLLHVLFSFGFSPRRVELSPEGHVTLHGDADAVEALPDPLAKWEADRASRPH